MTYKYPVYRPYLHGNEMKYVNDCLKSTWISSKGEYVEKFETAFAKFVGINHASTCTNGTVAIHLALLALGIGRGDEVIVPSCTYVATVNPVVYCGATPVFSDSIYDTWQIDPTDIESQITQRTKAIIVVHLYGNPCKMFAICQMAKKYNLYVIEDCAESFGSYYLDRHTGTFGDIATFSFFANKTITTGEGGMVITNSQDLHDKVCHLKNQAVAREYYHDAIGYNYRMTNIACAIGLAQLEQANTIISLKTNIQLWYSEYLTCDILKNTGLAWMNCILVENRDALREYLSTNGIETRPVFYPIHKMPMYATEDYMPMAEYLGSHGINLPSYPELTERDVIWICELINKFTA
jgi:perosamine synthetase